jgi:hypothetical protein
MIYCVPLGRKTEWQLTERSDSAAQLNEDAGCDDEQSHDQIMALNT